jgi:hypothetical protein
LSRLVRRRRNPKWKSLAVAALFFPIFLLLAGFIMRAVLIGLGDAGVPLGELDENVLLGILIAIAVVLAYLPSRMIYSGLRWELVENDGRFCLKCGYDLTGNVSGRCPECGREIADRRRSK